MKGQGMQLKQRVKSGELTAESALYLLQDRLIDQGKRPKDLDDLHTAQWLRKRMKGEK